MVIGLERFHMIIYARINRQIEAKWYGRFTRPLEFILFDNPQITAHLVEENPMTALCFPMRVIAWVDEIGRCLISYKDPLITLKEFHVDIENFDWPDLRPIIARILSE